mmetsp:Transcript_7740/g.14562  ORF Transcript_7740/g.14562 Transcript_7740/m.14562 type:complete len:566 (+) Transcript_7740:82-1779(+)
MALRGVLRLGLACCLLVTLVKARKLRQNEIAKNENEPTPDIIEEINEEGESSTQPPHIVFVLVDDMGFGDIGYQSKDLAFATPYLDELAADGIKLDRYYSNAVCTPSRASLMTGRYGSNTGLQDYFIVQNTPFGLPHTMKILPQFLKDAYNYRTVAVGKWHLGHMHGSYLPSTRGWDRFYGYYTGYIDYMTHEAESIQCAEEEACFKDLHTEQGPLQGMDNVHTTYLLQNAVEDIVEAHDPAEPLLLYYAMANPHYPLEAPEDFVEKNEATLAQVPNAQRRTFAALVMMIDEAVRRLVAKLEKKGMWENTVLVFASDNGADAADYAAGCNLPLRGNKGTVWEGGVRVPAFVHSPMFTAAQRGRTYDGYFHVADWLPTLVEGLAGRGTGKPLQVQHPLDGMDLWAALLGEAEANAERTEVLLGLQGKNQATGEYKGYTTGALIVGEWKLVHNEVETATYSPPTTAEGAWTEVAKAGSAATVSALYNIAADPNEETDLQEAYPFVYEYLLQRLGWHEERALQSEYCALKDTSAYEVWAANGGFVGPWVGRHYKCPVLVEEVYSYSFD